MILSLNGTISSQLHSTQGEALLSIDHQKLADISCKSIPKY